MTRVLREISLDTETTGLRVSEGHRVISIGCVEILNRAKLGRAIEIYINPGRPSDKNALVIHGIADDFLKTQPPFVEIASQFLDFIEDSTLVIHNAGFDVGFLNHELQRVGRKLIDKNRVIDTLPLARNKYPGAPATLDALCKRFGIDNSARVKHGALIDAELLASVYMAMNGAAQAEIKLFEEEGAGSPGYISPMSLSKKRNEAMRCFKLSKGEAELHSSAISKIKNPIWDKYISSQDS